MRRSIIATLAGLRAAWQTPATIARGLSTLVAPVTPPAAPLPASSLRDAHTASRAAHRAIGRLARLASPRWRNTCLYRSVAECLALRAVSLPARLVIGVGMSATDADVIAHAWVECEGVTCLATRGQAELETMLAQARRAAPPASAGAS